jgi:hypothetical protein
MNHITSVLVLVLRGGSYTAPIHSAVVSPDGRWVRVRTADLSPIDGAQVPEEPAVAVAAGSYGRSWALVSQGRVVTAADEAVAAIRSAAPAMELAERILAGLAQPAAVPAAADADGDLDDD